MRAAILAEPGVTEALYREPNPVDGGKAYTVARMHPDWHSDGARSGDLFVISNPGFAFGEPTASSNPLPGNHGAPQTADNFLAVAGGGELVRQRTPTGTGRATNPVNVDLAPTVMGLFGLFAPENSRGSFLRKAFARGELERVARPHRPAAKLKGNAIVIAPRGGTYDAQARLRGRWERVAAGTTRSRLKLRRLPDEALIARVRVRSAADVAGAWRRIKLR